MRHSHATTHTDLIQIIPVQWLGLDLNMGNLNERCFRVQSGSVVLSQGVILTWKAPCIAIVMKQSM